MLQSHGPVMTHSSHGGLLQAFVLAMVLLHLIEAGASGLAVTGTGISVLVGTALVLTIIETSVSQLVLSFTAGPT